MPKSQVRAGGAQRLQDCRRRIQRPPYFRQTFERRRQDSLKESESNTWFGQIKR